MRIYQFLFALQIIYAVEFAIIDVACVKNDCGVFPR